MTKANDACPLTLGCLQKINHDGPGYVGTMSEAAADRQVRAYEDHNDVLVRLTSGATHCREKWQSRLMDDAYEVIQNLRSLVTEYQAILKYERVLHDHLEKSSERMSELQDQVTALLNEAGGIGRLQQIRVYCRRRSKSCRSA